MCENAIVPPLALAVIWLADEQEHTPGRCRKADRAAESLQRIGALSLVQVGDNDNRQLLLVGECC